MDAESAKRIIESKGIIEVLYNGSPVWIQDVNADTARIKFLDSNEERDVMVKELVEADKAAH